MTNFFPRLLLLLALPLVTLTARAQNVGIGTTAPDVSAALDIVSSDKGALLPRVAAAAAIASPATGLLVFQTGSPAGFYFNAGTPGSPSWQQLATAAGATITATNGLTKTGSAIALGGTLAGNTTLGLGGFNLGLTGGNVGIGTSSPAALLEVVGNVPTYVLTVDQQNTTGNSSTSNSGYWQSFTAGVSGPLDQVVTYDGTFDNVGGNPQVPCGALLAIYQGTGTGGAALATQSYTVPVYTNAPTAVTFGAPATLVAGQVYTYRVSLVSPPTSSTYLITLFCPTNCYAGGSNSMSGSWDAKFQTGRLTTSVIAASKLAVTPNGVGIGTATPTQALDVVGSSTVSGNATVGGSVGIGTGTPAQKLDVVGNSTVSGNATVGGSVGIGTGTPAQRLDVVGNATVSGNVGIGTSNPGQKLEVSGTVYSTSGGFKFPDGTTQASAAVAPVNQTLSLNGQNLTISGAGGNTIALPASISSASNGLSATAGNATLGGPLTVNTDVPLNSKALTFSGSGSVGIGTATPAPSAALDVSSTTKGLLPPHMTQVERNAIASPAAGLTLYNTSTNKLNTWNGTAWTETLTTAEQPYQGPAVTFNYTGGLQTYTVPAGVHSLSVDAIGASGGTGLKYNGAIVGAGGNGARVRATLAVTPGETLTLYVGGAGTQPVTNGPAGGAGYNGGGNANSNGARGGGGGGASDVRRSTTAPSTALAERLLVAAGGGGGSGGNSNNCCYAGAGGAGGAPNGATGGTLYSLEPPGTGATQSAGGSIGGSLGQGGDGAGSGYSGGAGGGGYYGGGGSSSQGAGGGGSSWASPTGTSGVAMTAGYQTGNGFIVLTPGPMYAAPVLDGSNFVNVPGTYDNLGNHTATQNLNLADKLLVGNGGTAGLGVSSTGNVGIGTAAPAQKLDVTGNATISGNVGIGTATPQATLQVVRGSAPNGTAAFEGSSRISHFSYGTAEDTYIRGGKATSNVLLNDNGGNVGIGTSAPAQKLDVAGNVFVNGNVGIGTSSPVYPLDVRSTVSGYLGSYGYLNTSGAGTFNNNGAAVPVSIFASGRILASEFDALSDRRLKTVVGRSDRAADLALLTKLRITDYTMRDRVQFGQRAFKKVIAQEVEEVFPQAVQQHTGFLPDVYALATAVQALPGDSLVALALPAPGLLCAAATGQRLKLIGEKDETLATLARPAAAGARTLVLRRAQAVAGGKVFVFGLEHADVRSVDYEALSMLHVSATQELARQVQELKAQNAALQTGSATDHASLLTLQAQMARLLGEAPAASAQARR